MQNEFYTDGLQIITTTDGVGSITSSTQLGSLSYTTGALSSTWADTHTTIFNTRSLQTVINAEILAVKKEVLVLDNINHPTATIGIQADESLGIGTYYGMNLYNSTDLDFGITSTFPYQGSVVFRQEGVGSTTTTTAIKQGSIIIDDPDIPHTTTFTSDTISSNGANDFTITSTNSNLALSSSGNITTACSGFVVSAGDYSLTISNTIAESIGSLPLDPITFRRNLAPTTFTSGNPCGLLEKTALNAVTSGTTTFTIANAFQTTMNTPLAAGRIFVLPAPSAGSIGYWYGICNKSTAQTITIQYPAATTIATIPVASSATNGGTVARFAVDFNGTSYSRIG